ncbi:uncharacterized protein [Euphorbia lathyris]|uniref:uncharacterized protein isoform X3 n=1 Tax=Euphorbia lathyris TaxID=212925 RepID=UPI003313EDA3
MTKKQHENFFQHVSASADFLSTGNNKMDILAPIAECCRRKVSLTMRIIRDYLTVVNLWMMTLKGGFLLQPKLPNGECPPGFIGFAVNMIYMDYMNLLYVSDVYGLKETYIYNLFSRLQVYKSREEMLLALPLISDGVISLDGGMITPNGFVSLRNRFDVGEERFGSVPSPAINDPYAHDSVGVLGEELCITTVLEYGAIHVWTMKDNSTDKRWSKVYSFDYIYCNLVPHYGCFQPIKYLDDGALLMFFSSTEALVYMDPIKHRFKYLNVHSMSKVEAIAYIPGFVSLKHILSGQNAKVHKVKSRCAKLKLHSETDVDIIEQRFYRDFYY